MFTICTIVFMPELVEAMPCGNGLTVRELHNIDRDLVGADPL
jgi:hypothetical protein